MGTVFCSISTSIDGFVAGPNQSREKPFGDGVDEDLLHGWMFRAAEENTAEIKRITDAGAFIMGRNMFGPPGGGEWDEGWTGWWGDDPPYHAPVFVLTHYPRASVPMKGGTTFIFVTEGIEAALEQARAAAGDADIAIAGGAATVNQYLAAGLIDELHLHLAPMVVGAGERLFDGTGNLSLEPIGGRHTNLVTHVTYRVAK